MTAPQALRRLCSPSSLKAAELERPELGGDDLGALEAHRTALAVKDPGRQRRAAGNRLVAAAVDGDWDRGAPGEQSELVRVVVLEAPVPVEVVGRQQGEDADGRRRRSPRPSGSSRARRRTRRGRRRHTARSPGARCCRRGRRRARRHRRAAAVSIAVVVLPFDPVTATTRRSGEVLHEQRGRGRDDSSRAARHRQGGRRSARRPGEWTTKSKLRSSRSDGGCTSSPSRACSGGKPGPPAEARPATMSSRTTSSAQLGPKRSREAPALKTCTEHRYPLASERRDTSDLRHAPMVHRRPRQSVDRPASVPPDRRRGGGRPGKRQPGRRPRASGLPGQWGTSGDCRVALRVTTIERTWGTGR